MAEDGAIRKWLDFSDPAPAPPELYDPVAVYEVGKVVVWEDRFVPRHRADQTRPARSFRYAGRAFTDERAWSQNRPPRHKLLPAPSGTFRSYE